MAETEKRHHLVVRITHWVNALALAIMVASGLRIFNAYPAFARKGETFCCYPFAGDMIPNWLTFGGWLAGARNWHFLAMLGLVALTFGHVFMVFAVDPYSMRAIITGRYNPARSPERRNARPFVHLRGPRVEPSAAPAPAPPSPPPSDQPPPSKPPEGTP